MINEHYIPEAVILANGEYPADERIELFQFLRDGAAYRIECNHSSGDVL